MWEGGLIKPLIGAHLCKKKLTLADSRSESNFSMNSETLYSARDGWDIAPLNPRIRSSCKTKTMYLFCSVTQKSYIHIWGGDVGSNLSPNRGTTITLKVDKSYAQY